MLVQYARDDANRRITIVTSGPLTLAEILANIDRQVREKTWSYAVLYDTGEADAIPTAEDVDHVIGRVRALAARLGRRGAVAIVTRNPLAFEIAREYAVVERDVGAVGFFRDLEAAERWLSQQVVPTTADERR